MAFAVEIFNSKEAEWCSLCAEVRTRQTVMVQVITPKGNGVFACEGDEFPYAVCPICLDRIDKRNCCLPHYAEDAASYELPIELVREIRRHVESCSYCAEDWHRSAWRYESLRSDDDDDDAPRHVCDDVCRSNGCAYLDC